MSNLLNIPSAVISCDEFRPNTFLKNSARKLNTKKNMCQKRFFILVIIVTLVDSCYGHGKMIDPPGRNSVMNNAQLAKYDTTFIKYPTECNNGGINYSDKANYCGGRSIQIQNGGNCSACGDSYSAPYPRKHDYNPSDEKSVGYKITPVRAYRQGQVATIKVYITASHLGTFEFRLCDKLESDYPGQDILTKCFSDKTQHRVLETVNGETQYGGPTGQIDHVGIYEIDLQLPEDVTCTRGCSLQWWYETGNNPGAEIQEHFVNCADILIFDCRSWNEEAHTDYCGFGPTDKLLDCENENTEGRKPKVKTGKDDDDDDDDEENKTQDRNSEHKDGGYKTESPKTNTIGQKDSGYVTTKKTGNENVDNVFPTQPYTEYVDTVRPTNNDNWSPGGLTNMPTCDACTYSRVGTCNNPCCQKKIIYSYKSLNSAAFDGWCNKNCERGYCPSNWCSKKSTIKWVVDDHPDCLGTLRTIVRELATSHTDSGVTNEDEANPAYDVKGTYSESAGSYGAGRGAPRRDITRDQVEEASLQAVLDYLVGSLKLGKRGYSRK